MKKINNDSGVFLTCIVMVVLAIIALGVVSVGEEMKKHDEVNIAIEKTIDEYSPEYVEGDKDDIYIVEKWDTGEMKIVANPEYIHQIDEKTIIVSPYNYAELRNILEVEIEKDKSDGN